MRQFTEQVNSDNDLFAVELSTAGNMHYNVKFVNEHHFYCVDIPETPIPEIIDPEMFDESRLNHCYQNGITLAHEQEWDTDKVVLVTNVRGTLFVLLENKVDRIPGGLFVRHENKWLVYTTLAKYMKGMFALNG